MEECTLTDTICSLPKVKMRHSPHATKMSVITTLTLSLLLVLAPPSWALRLHIPCGGNYAGSVLANVSFPSPRVYGLSSQHNAHYVHRLFEIDPLTGVVRLRHSLRCRAPRPEAIAPNPALVVIETRTFNIDGSDPVHLTLTTLQVSFEDETCTNLTNPTAGLDGTALNLLDPESIFSWPELSPSSAPIVSRALLSLSDDRLCIHSDRFLARLSSLMPTVLVGVNHSQCRVFHQIVEGSGRHQFGDQDDRDNFRLEHLRDDLVARRNACLKTGAAFDVSIAQLVMCHTHPDHRSHGHHHHHPPHAHFVSSNRVEHLVLTFYSANDIDLEDYFARIRHESMHQPDNDNRSRSRRETASSGVGPSFDRSLYIVNVPEEREKLFVVTHIVANSGRVSSGEGESSELLYSLSALIDARSQSMFTIDPVSGLVTTTTRLDREFMDVHYLRVSATDGAVPPRTATTTLQINVLDENDHVPVFEQPNYEASLRESAPIGTTVLTVRATDHDAGSNAQIDYTLLNPTANDAFRIDAKTGVVTTRTALDREKNDLYSLTIQASDSGPPATRKRSQTSLGIKILDENDNYPQFAERSYSVLVDEDINYASRPVILRIVAFDADEGLNAAVRYSIIGGNTAAAFGIDSLNGEVSVLAPLDYENARSYRLVVRAQDGGSPPRANTTQLLVSVVDKNDNEPRFYTSLFQESVLENVPAGTSVLRVQAYDADDGENAQLSYHIQTVSGRPVFGEPSSTSNLPIALDAQSGWMVTTRELDREESALYEFTVVARDAGQQPMQHTATASVIIRVQDLNDNAPVFEPRIYEAAISETALPGTSVTTVSATDRDENSRIVFAISGGNVRNRFAIVSQSNQGIITLANSLDYKLERSFVLTVTATDTGGKMDTATVYVNVSDANTHRPVIQLKTVSAGETISLAGTSTALVEDAPMGTAVLLVEATDEDVGENARITYTLNDVAEFRIDPASGLITTTKPLDRETSPGYSLVVTAQDNGVPPLSDIVNIEIEVVDVNDNKPQFEQELYTSSVMEDAPVGTSVAQVRAHDRDLGLNGQVRYDFHGESARHVFQIEPTSGVVRTNRSLDRETTARYDLRVVAYDRGTPTQSSIVPLQITIDDCNDNPPRFSSDRLRFYVPENSPVGTVVGELRATDADEGGNAKIEYTIVGGVDMKWFALKPSSNAKDSSASLQTGSSSPFPSDASGSIALLVTRTEMDYESDKKVYNIIVRASSLPLRNDVEVEIYVTDVNDHAPLLRDFSIIFNNYRGHFPTGLIIGRVPAFDADVADVLRYRFVSGNKASLLYLNESSGEVRLSPSLNTNVPTRAMLEVGVSDGLNEALARCFLSVNLVTETMLSHSVTLRVRGVTMRYFLSMVYDRFLDSLASVIPCPRENVIIFNVQDDTETSSPESILAISFSSRLSESLRDTESYYSPLYLQERVYLSRTMLTKMTELEILPFDDNLCVREPCLNYEECLSVTKFGNASSFYATEAILFRAIAPVATFACRCPIGFQGMHHKYECDIEINLCFSAPCHNGGECRHREGGFVCLCPEGFTGKTCEISFARDQCQAGACRGGSRCLSNAGRAMKVKPSMVRAGLKLDKALVESEGITGFQCVECPFPSDWASPVCELRARSFSRGTYLTFSSLRERHRLNLRLKFATRRANGLLLYNGRYNEQHDFIGLELIEGRVRFIFSLGGAPTAEVSVGEQLADGKWHEVEVIYINRSVTLKLDGCDDALLAAVERYDLGESYACAARTTLELEGRCLDRMQTCYRFLDLAGPLQVGGLPPLPTQFQVNNVDFEGCIADLHIDNTLVDLDAFVANNGSSVGCDAKKSTCRADSCSAHGRCRDSWRGHVCHCEDGWMGVECAEEAAEAVRHFKGDGMLAFTPSLQPLAYPWTVTFDLRTRSAAALILAIHLGQTSMVKFELTQGGRLTYSFDAKPPAVMNTWPALNDGLWHHVEARWTASGLVVLDLDYGQQRRELGFAGVEILGLYIAKVVVGGHDTPDELSEAYTFRSMAPNYVGCLKRLDVGNSKDAWLRPTLETNVHLGCGGTRESSSSTDVCASGPCPENADCVTDGQDGHECRCRPGHVGRHCIPVCQLNPCAAGATCVRSNETTLGYRCVCDDRHTGLRCEDRLPDTCPADWWGHPICGPCNCDVAKGYDGNCNKTTGECRCQANRFQPAGSDVCYDCDCYATGSYSAKCDETTGQCQCRPGVLGRRCDICPSPFAEVTSRGCEVIYDACPRAYADGIWWERTKFGSLASHQCPLGSSGRAKRQCREGEGWLKAELFECQSDTFVELAEQVKALAEVDGTLKTANGSWSPESAPLLNTQHSIRLVQDLRSAINVTEPLYGGDLVLAFRLVRRVLENELRQTGLNLTHKQDRHFMRNLCESISALLDPRYTHLWERVAELEGQGPEVFVKLFGSYAEVLIDNQRDTFTEPFEIATKWMVFGLDTVSTTELWDVPRELLNRLASPMPSLRTPVALNSTPSVYLDFSLAHDPLASGVSSGASNMGVVLPKYNNYPQRKQYIDELTKVVVPLKLLNVPSIDDVKASAPSRPSSASVPHAHSPNALVAYTSFTSLAHFLPSQTDSSVRQRFSQPLRANTPIVSVTMKAANGSRFLTKSLHPRLHFRLRTLSREGRTSPQCVYWAFPVSSSSMSGAQSPPATSGVSRRATSRGRWSSRGCELTGSYPLQRLRTAYDYINCTCDRGSGVAVLMDTSPGEYLGYEESPTQVALTTALSVLSLLLLIVTHLILTLIRGLETNSNSIHRNLVVCLFVTLALYLVSLRARSELVQVESMCRLVAIGLHYAFQCLFTWMLIDSIHLYRMLTEIRDVNHGPMRFYYVLGYAAPAIIVALAVGLRADQYGNHLFCWLSIYEGVIWALVTPICILILLNLFVFLLALQASVQMKAAVCDYGNLRILLWLSIVLLPLLAALWILALLAVNDALDELHYAHSVVSLMCALYVFVGHCLVNRRVRHNIRITWLRLTRSSSRGSEESFTATRTSAVQQTPAHATVRHGLMQPMDQMMMGMEAEPSSSTTSRSNRAQDIDAPHDSLDGREHIDAVYYDGHDKQDRHHRRHRKCRRRRHRTHRSGCKAIYGSETTGSSDDVSYDQSMELASSHSSDEDEDGPGAILNLQERLRPSGPLLEAQMQRREQQEMLEQAQQNQINTLIRQQHTSSSIYSNPLAQPSNGESDHTTTSSTEAATIIYGQRTAPEATLQRSNILAMTAGLSEQCPSPYGTTTTGNPHYQQPVPRSVPQSQLVEHIYSYARRPGQHYSSLGPTMSARPATIDDSIGLPTAVYHPHEENPYGLGVSIVPPRPLSRSTLADTGGGNISPNGGSGSSQSSHVRLLNQAGDVTTTTTSPSGE